MDDRRHSAFKIVIIFDTNKRIFATDPYTTSSFVYVSWLAANQLLQVLTKIITT